MMKSNGRDLKQLKRDVAEKLNAFHLGRARVITAGELAAHFNCPEPTIRAAISELCKDGIPVASTTRKPPGFWIPATAEEAVEGAQHLRSRIRKISQRAAGYRRGVYARFHNVQLTFPGLDPAA